jgi:hypothetical protein
MSPLPLPPNGEILLYQTEDGRARVESRFQHETTLLSQALIADLFQVTVPTVNERLKNIFDDKELEPEATIRNFRIVCREGPVNSSSWAWCRRRTTMTGFAREDRYTRQYVAHELEATILWPPLNAQVQEVALAACSPVHSQWSRPHPRDGNSLCRHDPTSLAQSSIKSQPLPEPGCLRSCRRRVRLYR